MHPNHRLIKLHAHAHLFFAFQLRQGQSYCTDTECVDRKLHAVHEIATYSFYSLIRHLNYFTVPLAGRGASADDGSNFAMMSMFLILAVILYIFRPNSLRRQRNTDEKQPLSSDGQVRSCECIHFGTGAR